MDKKDDMRANFVFVFPHLRCITTPSRPIGTEDKGHRTGDKNNQDKDKRQGQGHECGRGHGLSYSMKEKKTPTRKRPSLENKYLFITWTSTFHRPSRLHCSRILLVIPRHRFLLLLPHKPLAPQCISACIFFSISQLLRVDGSEENRILSRWEAS